MIKKKFKDLLAKVLYEKYYNLFNVYKYLNRKKFIKALNIERKIMSEFLIDLYKEIYNVNYVITDKDLGDFIERISKIADFPFEKHKLLSHLEKCDKMDLNIENPEMKAQEFYNFLSTFFNTIQESIIKT